MSADVRMRLDELQRRFGQVLRTPLDRGSGTLRAVPEAYDATLRAAITSDGDRSADDRLAVYNRQYWFRLFGVFQQAYRLATALVGPWAFNELAARFVIAHPPRGHDLGRVIDGFDTFSLRALPEAGVSLGSKGRLPRAALLEAIQIDDAHRTVFEAPYEVALQLSVADADHLAHARLRPSRAFVMIDETWPLSQLRHELPATLSEQCVPLPPPHADGRRSWAVVRTADGQRVIPLAAPHARLLRLLREHPLGEALAILEASVPPSTAAGIATAAQRWFADGVKLGFWTALEDGL